MLKAQQLGRYHLMDRIAFGGMAEIFRAKTFDSGGQVHLVAVKRVLAHLVEDQDFLQMLVDEAKISALLRHENIARLYEFARAGDEYFLAMEYVDGKDLRSLLERGRTLGKPIPPEHVAWVAMETAHALHAAHTQRDGAGRALRIVHRDVSPSNVLCSYHGEVKLCDFGIAKATLTRVQTKTGVIKGKVKYMSPEQAMGRKLDHRSDLFSLGTVMYEMLTLQAPFQAPTEIELIFAVRDARKTPIQELTPDVPEEMCRIVDKAMTRSRAARYQSGEDLALDLRIFLDRHAPGYRRSHFSRYMRKVFEEEIERELRQLEAYEIGGADVQHLGENLIAEALGPDAPFTRFSPLYANANELTNLGTSNFPHIEAPQPTDLHVQPTMMLDRAKLGLAPVEPEPPAPPAGDLHSEQTRILAPATPKPQPASLHEQETGEKELPTAEGYRSGGAPAGPMQEQDTDAVEKLAPEDLHGQATMILFNPLAEAAPTVPYDRHQHGRQPDEATPLPQPIAPTDFGGSTETSPTTPRADNLVAADAPSPGSGTMPTAPAASHAVSDFASSPPTVPTPREPTAPLSLDQIVAVESQPRPIAFKPGSVEDFEHLKDTGEEPTSVPLADDDIEPVG